MSARPSAAASGAHRVVVVGGGAAGLELATVLGDKLARRGRAHVTLVDRGRTHLWKPLLHEVAAGSMDIHQHQLDYLAQGRWHRFQFSLGAFAGIDREKKELLVGAVADVDGEQILPERRIPYDTLVISIGSESNDFGTPGVREHAFTLDDAWQANLFHRKLVNACFRANYAADGATIHIAIVGAGATGVELAAELHNTTRVLATYGLANFDPEKQIRIAIVEAGPRILAGLPDYVAEETLKVLEGLGVRVLTGQKVVEVTESAVKTASGVEVPGTFVVWAAGIRCSETLTKLGLETDRLNRLVVKPTLETTRDPDIFAVGDCAACPWLDGKLVPPRAQAAHQQASHLVPAITARAEGRHHLRPYRYRDFGSLISLGHYDTVGQLMGFVGGGRMRVEGFLAKVFYIALYRQHIWALYGFWRMALDTLARLIKRQTEPKVKLH